MNNMIGLSLIEVLISLFILSFILLGFSATQWMALRDNRDAYFFNLAIYQLENMIEKLKDSNDLTKTLAEWNKQNAEVLPEGKGFMTGNYPDYQLILCWGKNKCLKTP